MERGYKPLFDIMEKFEVNDRIPVYEILNDGNYPEGQYIAGTWRMGRANSDDGNNLSWSRLRDVRSNKTILQPDFHVLFIEPSGNAGELNAKRVGTMVVKKLKDQNL